MAKIYKLLSPLFILALILTGCMIQQPPRRSITNQAVGQVMQPAATIQPTQTPPEQPAAVPEPTRIPAGQPTPASGGVDLYQLYYDKAARFSFLIPSGWTVSGPEETPLGRMTLLGPPPVAAEGPANSTIIVADAAQITAAEALDLLCTGGCPETQLQDTVIGGQPAQLAIVGGGDSPAMTWYFVEHEANLIYFSIHHPQSLETLYGVVNTLTFGPSPEGPATIPAVQAAQQALAGQLNLSPYLIAVQSAEPAEWQTRCLGRPEEEEPCAEAVTPGYIGMLEVQARQLFEYRASEDGGIIRLTPGAALAAVQVLAQQLQLSLDQVQIISAGPAEWPTGCLGLPAENESCAGVVTPGYTVTLEANGQRYVYHVDDTAGNLRLAEAPEPNLEDAALIWTQEAEGCQTAAISQQGVAFGPCGRPLMTVPRFALETRPEELAAFVRTYAPFEAETPAGMISFNGRGTVVAAPAEQRMMAEWSRLVVLEAQAGRSGAAWGMVIGWNGQAARPDFCNNLSLDITGEVFASTALCGGGQASNLGQVRLSAAQLAQVYGWVDSLQSFEIAEADPALVEPTTYLIFSGSGPAEASLAEKEAIQAFAVLLFEQLSQE